MVGGLGISDTQYLRKVRIHLEDEDMVDMVMTMRRAE